MTLQDFFVSGLPSGDAKPQLEPSTKATTTTELTESEKNRVKIDKKQPAAPQKPAPPKGI